MQSVQFAGLSDKLAAAKEKYTAKARKVVDETRQTVQEGLAELREEVDEFKQEAKDTRLGQRVAKGADELKGRVQALRKKEDTSELPEPPSAPTSEPPSLPGEDVNG